MYNQDNTPVILPVSLAAVLVALLCIFVKHEDKKLVAREQAAQVVKDERARVNAALEISLASIEAHLEVIDSTLERMQEHLEQHKQTLEEMQQVCLF